MSGKFDLDQPLGRVLFSWWKSLGDNRGDRAELRRCQSLLEVMMTPAYHHVRRRLADAGLKSAEGRDDRLALVIGLAAHVNSTFDPAAHHALPRLAEAFSEGEKPSISPLRFRQLLGARTDDELFIRLRRVLPLVKERANLFNLANDVFYWGDRVRKRWVYEYHWPAKESA